MYNKFFKNINNNLFNDNFLKFRIYKLLYYKSLIIIKFLWKYDINKKYKNNNTDYIDNNK